MILLAQGSSLSVYGLKETVSLSTIDTFGFGDQPTVDMDSTRCTSACMRLQVIDEEQKPQELVTLSGYHYWIQLVAGKGSGAALTMQGPDEKEAPKLKFSILGTGADGTIPGKRTFSLAKHAILCGAGK